MSALLGLKKTLLFLLVLILVVAGCSIPSSYRPAPQKTIRDFSHSGKYVKKVGILALLNNTSFVGDQVPVPFMAAFLESIQAAASDASLVIPGKMAVAPFLWNPPRIADGNLDVFALAHLARQEGMNALVSPLLMDIRVHSRKTGFWIFRDMEYDLQVQTAAALYDAITGARLALVLLNEEFEIDAYDAERIRNGEEVIAGQLIEVIQEMGEELGERMGKAIEESQWLASVVAVEDGSCLISAGSEVGVAAGDRFSVLDASGILTGLDGQKYIVPGVKIGELTVDRVTARQSLGKPNSGKLLPAGSIVVPE